MNRMYAQAVGLHDHERYRKLFRRYPRLRRDRLADVIKNREDLIHVLTEAAEIEHNLLCSYLYAAFSIKRGGEGGLTESQAIAAERWRKTILSVAVEEMAHLSCVNNLLLAVGGAAHFDRPNLPVAPGYHPSEIVVRLAPFTIETLDHFIFLERPLCDHLPDGEGFQSEPANRKDQSGSLTPSAINYRTIGDLYDAVAGSLTQLADELGETTLFALGGRGQVDAKQTGLSSVVRITSLQSALEVVEQIKEQGEGSSGAREDSHFDRFQEIKSEWSELLKADPNFKPAWPAAHDPVMRRPLVPDRVWIGEGSAAQYLDCANAGYGLMLTVLQQAYSLENVVTQTVLMKLAFALMEIVAHFGNAVARMPVGSSHPAINAGMTFTVPRNLGVRVGSMIHQLQERLDVLHARMLAVAPMDKAKIHAAFEKCRVIVRSIP